MKSLSGREKIIITTQVIVLILTIINLILDK